MNKIYNLDDQRLLTLIKKGGRDLEEAFEDLLNHEYRFRSIRKLVVGMGAQSTDYEEILDDTLIALHRSIRTGRFEGKGSIYSYMHGIAKNLWLKKCAKKKMKFVPITHDMDLEDVNAETEMINTEKQKALLKAIQRLGQSCQKLLTASFIDGIKNVELVTVMNYKNDAVVRKAKSNCLKKLLTLFRESPILLNQLR